MKAIYSKMLLCVKQIASGKLSVLHRELSSVLCDDLDGWDGGGSGREAQEGGDTYIYTYTYG